MNYTFALMCFALGVTGFLIGKWTFAEPPTSALWPDNAILLIKDENCPKDWQPYKKASGLYILGADTKNGRKAGTVGKGRRLDYKTSELELNIKPKSEPGIIIPDTPRNTISSEVVTSIKGVSEPDYLSLMLCER